MLRSIKISLAILILYLKRQFRSFWENPLKPSGLKIVLILAVIFLILLVLGGSRYKDELFRPTLSEGVISIYKEGEYPAIVGNLLSKGLFTTDQSGKVVPNLAEVIESNPEGSIYTVKLKDGLSWADGTKLLAQDINFNFSGAELSYPDQKTIQFKLAEPFSPFPSLLTRPIYKKSLSPTSNALGAGPYFLTKTQDLAEEGYRIKKLYLRSSEKNLPDLVISIYPTENLAKEALKLGEVQALIGINDQAAYQKQNNLKFFSKTNLTQLVAVFYNTKDPILSDENYRMALSFAAPAITGQTEAKTSLPENSWAFNGAVKDYLDNKDQAKNYLQKVKNGRDQPLILTTTANLSWVGQKVVESWIAQGIKADLKVESGVPQNFQALLITQIIPIDPDQYALWHSTQSQTNISKVSNPRIDKDLEDGRRIIDPEKRKQIYQDFQKVLLDHSPATFLYFPQTQVVYNKKIEAELRKIIDLQLNP